MKYNFKNNLILKNKIEKKKLKRQKNIIINIVLWVCVAIMIPSYLLIIVN